MDKGKEKENKLKKFFNGLFEKVDKKMQEKAKKSNCCCGGGAQDKSCCS